MVFGSVPNLCIQDCAKCAALCSVWLFVELFSKQGGRNVAEARVVPLAVVTALDVFLVGSLRIGACCVALMMHQLVFQAAPGGH